MPQQLAHARERFEALLAQGEREPLAAFLDELDRYDLLRLLDDLDDATLQRLLRVVGRRVLAELLAQLEPEDAARLFDRLEVAQQADLAERMDPDDAADVLSEMEVEDAHQVLAEMLPEGSRDVQALLDYPPDTAGGRMTPEFVAIQADWTVRQTLDFLRTQGREAETVYYLYVTDRAGRLRGVVSLRDLLFASEATPIGEIMNDKVIYVTVDDDQEEVARLIAAEDLLALPVVDFAGRLVGIVTVDDVLDVLEEEYGEDILKFGAIEGGEERSLASPRYSVRHRLPWLLINIALSQVGVIVVSLFNDTLARAVVLAPFMPLISNMGGNVGIQAVSVAIRGISTGEVSFGDFWRVLRKEFLVGLTNGLILGALLGGVAYLWHGNYFLGVVTTLALWANVLVASLAGGTLPFLLKRLGFDPAMMTGPLLTTLVDLISFFIYLGLGTLFLDRL